jgi:hypothetical protein
MHTWHCQGVEAVQQFGCYGISMTICSQSIPLKLEALRQEDKRLERLAKATKERVDAGWCESWSGP